MKTCLIGVGACYLDTILTVSHFPTEDEKLRASKLERRRGGNVPNTLEVLQQLLVESHLSANQDDRRIDSDLKLVLLAVLPSSSSLASQQVRSSLEGPIVDLSRCFYREAFQEAASSYIIRSLESGSRTIVNYNELPEMTTEEFMNSISINCEERSISQMICHFEGRIPNITRDCIHYLRRAFPDTIISVEVEKPDRPGLQELAVEADLVFYSKSWAKTQGYQSAEECLLSQASLMKRMPYLCCTWGEAGAAALKLPAKTIFSVPAKLPEGNPIVDTIGAGDTFIAGILYGLFYNTEKWNLEKSLKFANELAGRKVMQEGFSRLIQNVEVKS